MAAIPARRLVGHARPEDGEGVRSEQAEGVGELEGDFLAVEQRGGVVGEGEVGVELEGADGEALKALAHHLGVGREGAGEVGGEVDGEGGGGEDAEVAEEGGEGGLEEGGVREGEGVRAVEREEEGVVRGLEELDGPGLGGEGG